jgi:predicted RNase H-like HicB family nuclease
MPFTEFKTTGKKSKKESLSMSDKGLKGVFSAFTGKSGGFWVSIVPSLNISGYGKTEKEAVSDLKYNIDVFCEDLFELTTQKRNIELKKLGWKKHTYFKKRFSASFIDENGILQNFDSPEKVKKISLEAA